MLPIDLEIAIIAPFPTMTRIQEGWMSRIASIDRIFSGFKRLYVFFAEHHPIAIDDRLMQHDTHAWEICLNPGEKTHQKLFAEIVNKVRGIYVHTVHLAAFIQDWLPSGKFVVDMHGIVPEEEVMLGRPHLAPHYAAVEQKVLEHAQKVVVVTDAMARHFLAKYPELSPPFLTFPIFESDTKNIEPSVVHQDELPVSVVYAGGTQAWQNIDAMLHFAHHCQEFGTFTFLSHEAEQIHTRAGELYPHLAASYRFCQKDKLPEAYAQHDFGLILRNDTAVNRVSCPTKLSEYLCYGLIPIVRSPSLGDFADLGYWYMTEEEFAEGFFPDIATRKWMIEANQEVVSRLRQRFAESATLLCEMFSCHELPKSSSHTTLSLCNPIEVITVDRQSDGNDAGELSEVLQYVEVQSLPSSALLLIEGEAADHTLATLENHGRNSRLKILLRHGQRLRYRQLPSASPSVYARLEDFRRAVLLPHVVLPCDTLEIGAFTAPTIMPHETRLSILDYYSTDDLREQAKALGREPQAVLEVNYICRSDRYDEVIQEQFDLIIANHVFEHISRPLDWLNCCGRLLRSEGILFLVIPDKKYNFDKFRSDTSLTQLLFEYFLPEQDAKKFQALDAALYYDWGYSGKSNNITTRLDEPFLRRSLQEWHPGAHSHVFQAETFLDFILKPILHLGLVDFGLLKFINYPPFGEFAIVLKKGGVQPRLTEHEFFRLAYDTVESD